MGPAAAVQATTAGLLVFLVCAAVLALLVAGAEAGMVETVAVATAAWGRGGCGRPAVAGPGSAAAESPLRRRRRQGLGSCSPKSRCIGL